MYNRGLRFNYNCRFVIVNETARNFYVTRCAVLSRGCCKECGSRGVVPMVDAGFSGSG
jgi:hypothetical protein